MKMSLLGVIVASIPFEKPVPTSACGAILIRKLKGLIGELCGSVFGIVGCVYLVNGESDAPAAEEQRAPANG